MKRYFQYIMDCNCKASWLSGIFMGIPVFLLSVYYLLIQEIQLVPGGEQFLYLWSPVCLCLVYLIFLRIIRLRKVLPYAVVAALVCLILLIQLFSTGNALRIFLGLLGYLAGGALVVLSALGYLPGRLIGSVVFLFILLIRYFLFGGVSGLAWLREVAYLSMLAAMMVLPVAFKDSRAGEHSSSAHGDA